MTSEYHSVLNKSSINRCKALYKTATKINQIKKREKKKTLTFSVEFRASQPTALQQSEIQEGSSGISAEGSKPHKISETNPKVCFPVRGKNKKDASRRGWEALL